MEKVYLSKDKCCGCALCQNVCPKSAIKMIPDKYGYKFPVIDQKKCIDCGLCRKNCIFINHDLNQVKDTYAAKNMNRDELLKSSSGGIFSAIADAFISNNGYVCGAVMNFENGNVNIKHKVINSSNGLYKLQGSKYVQSDISDVLVEVKNKLKDGKDVLFSGTPCQVAAIKKFTKNVKNGQLYTIDIICHGVPSLKMFDDYIQQVAMKKKISIHKFNFRDKRFGWGYDGSIEGIDDQGNEFFEQIIPNNSSYYRFFLDGEIYRESCYHCPFAQDQRVGDITIGDYWGVQDYSPELMKENGGNFASYEGISCLLINTDNGNELINKFGINLYKENVDYDKIKIVNTQLTAPAQHTKLRNRLLDAYIKKGYAGVEKIYERQYAWHRLKQLIKKILIKMNLYRK